MASRLITAVLASSESAPEKPAVRCSGSSVHGRGDIVREARRLGAKLDRETPAGSTVLIQGPAGAGFHSAVLATWGTGRRALTIGPLPEEDVHGLVDAHVPAARILTEPGFDAPSGAGLLELAATFESEHDLAELDRGTEASLLLQSSGTVGRARVALRTAEAIDRVGETLVKTIGVLESDRILSALPMHHAYGIEHAVLLPLLTGAEVIQMPSFQIDVALDLLLEDATILPAVPPTIEALGVTTPDRTSLRIAYTAGSPLPASTRERFEHNWGVKVGDLYGASEVGTITWGFDGRTVPVAGVEVNLADDGELMVKSDAMFEGYLDSHSEPPSRERIREGWFLSGDLASIEPSGEVRLIGRARLQFDVGGLKVNPIEVEDVLREHEAVAEVLVAPLQLSETIKRVHARIVPSVATTADHSRLIASVTDFARRHLPPHQVPRRIELVDALPRTASGKIIRANCPQTAPTREG